MWYDEHPHFLLREVYIGANFVEDSVTMSIKIPIKVSGPLSQLSLHQICNIWIYSQKVTKIFT